jgi:hypothetical protein
MLTTWAGEGFLKHGEEIHWHQLDLGVSNIAAVLLQVQLFDKADIPSQESQQGTEPNSDFVDCRRWGEQLGRVWTNAWSTPAVVHSTVSHISRHNAISLRDASGYEVEFLVDYSISKEDDNRQPPIEASSGESQPPAEGALQQASPASNTPVVIGYKNCLILC